MPYLLEDLDIDRVDLVDEGANSAAFIELFKRKEQSAKMDINEILSKMKPEHSTAIKAELDRLQGEIAKANEQLATAEAEKETANAELEKAKGDLEATSATLATVNSELEVAKAKKADECSCEGEADENGICKECGKPKKKAAFDEAETMKSMPENVRVMFEKLKAQKEVAEEEVRKAKEAEKDAEAIAKAKELKALPVETEKLVGILKNCDKDFVDILSTINEAIDGVVLGEVGKSNTANTTSDAWSKIEAKAAEVSKRDNVTIQKATAIVIKENPDMYKEYLQGGAK